MLQLGPDLELLVLNALMRGVLPPRAVRANELSKEGRYVWQAIKRLSGGSEGPFAPRTVFVTATDVLGGDPEHLRDYIRKADTCGDGLEGGALLRSIRQKQQLLALINEASEQLGSGQYNPGVLAEITATDDRANGLEPLVKYVSETLPELPKGPGIKSLPRLSEVSGGVFGFWAIGGEPGIGKSTLALQIAVSLQRVVPVMYYDFEQGREALLSHLALALDKDVRAVRQATGQLYLRDTLRTLTADLQQIKPPALIIVDSIQKAPTSQEFRRVGLDNWVHKFEALKRRGYSVIGVSELGRASYQEAQKKGMPKAKLGGFKESGEIEYAADFGVQLTKSDYGEGVEVYVVKNRHRPYKGMIGEMERMNAWWFRECGAASGREVH